MWRAQSRPALTTPVATLTSETSGNRGENKTSVRLARGVDVDGDDALGRRPDGRPPSSDLRADTQAVGMAASSAESLDGTRRPEIQHRGATGRGQPHEIERNRVRSSTVTTVCRPG